MDSSQEIIQIVDENNVEIGAMSRWLMREQNLLTYFPGRTEGDLYLWFINRHNVLKEAYSEQEPAKPPDTPELESF